MGALGGKEQRIAALLAPVVQDLGYQLWGIDYVAQGRRALLRIYIDSENGISVDDCALVSRQVSAVLDVEDPIAGEYTLEVSSPGMDRPLYSLDQFQLYLGSEVAVRLRSAFEGRRKFSGVLKAIEDEELVLQVDDHEYLLPFELVERAHVVPRF